MTQNFRVDKLEVQVHPSYHAMSEAATQRFAQVIQQVLAQKQTARAIFAVAPSQYGFQERAAQRGDIDWPRITCFHMDEYVGLDQNDTGSLAKMFYQKLIAPAKPAAFHAINGRAALVFEECWRYEKLLREQPIDVCVLGIGENGHIAFNEPHMADFDDPVWVKPVRLDEKSRMQQAREKTFGSEAAVPTHAITLTVPALLSAQTMICIVPGAHKAEAVQQTLKGPISTDCPATGLRNHPRAELFLDQESASQL